MSEEGAGPTCACCSDRLDLILNVHRLFLN